MVHNVFQRLGHLSLHSNKSIARGKSNIRENALT